MPSNPTTRQLTPTDDGSTTLLDPRTGDTYHSTYGAKSESQLIYVQYGLLAYCQRLTNQVPASAVNILEMGLGTGLNLLLSLEAAKTMPQLEICYTAYEYYPLQPAEWEQLDFPPFSRDAIARLHQAEWGKPIRLASNFCFTKRLEDFRHVALPDSQYQVVYYDAFAPSCEPSLWTPELLAKVARAMTQEAIFVTYSTKGDVLRALRQAGLCVAKLPGPKGKREVTQAQKTTRL